MNCVYRKKKEAGECKYTDLFGTLIRFKLHKITIVADMEKVFFNIGTQENDRDVLRFLWKEDPCDIKLKLKVLVHVSSMFHLEATIDHHLNSFLEYHSKINPGIINKIRHSLYVNDLSSGTEKLKNDVNSLT